MKQTDEEMLNEITNNWTGNPKMRVCPMCLNEVARDDYDKHMQGHGYTTIYLNDIALPNK